MIQLLQDFARKPFRKTAIENLIFLKERSISWAATFFYTDMKPSAYKKLDDSIAYCVVRLTREHGFVVRNSPYPSDNLEKLGVPTFTRAMLAIRIRKSKAMTDFYPERNLNVVN